MKRRAALGRVVAGATAPLFGCVRVACAHEIDGNRLTLVLRDARHLVATFYMGYGSVLHRTLAPRQPVAEFLAAAAAMEPERFAQAQVGAHGMLERATRLLAPAGRRLELRNWAWPDAARAQTQLRERLMQSLVAPQDHAHEAVTEVRAEASAPFDVNRLSVELPEALQPVLVVSYRPHQAWTTPAARQVDVRF